MGSVSDFSVIMSGFSSVVFDSVFDFEYFAGLVTVIYFFRIGVWIIFVPVGIINVFFLRDFNFGFVGITLWKIWIVSGL